MAASNFISVFMEFFRVFVWLAICCFVHRSSFVAGELPDDAQRFTGIFDLKNVRLRAAAVGRMQDQHQFPIESFENHSVAAVVAEKRFVLLPPRAG
jgi:hypothetical protein